MISHGVVYETARRDLMEMAEEFKLLQKVKSEKKLLFLAPEDLYQRLKDKG